MQRMSDVLNWLFSGFEQHASCCAASDRLGQRCAVLGLSGCRSGHHQGHTWEGLALANSSAASVGRCVVLYAMPVRDVGLMFLLVFNSAHLVKPRQRASYRPLAFAMPSWALSKFRHAGRTGGKGSRKGSHSQQ